MFTGQPGCWPLPWKKLWTRDHGSRLWNHYPGQTDRQAREAAREPNPDYVLAVFTNATPFPNTPPIITAQPIGITVSVGATATFSVSAEGAQPLAYQWQFGGTNIANATNAVLMLSNVQLSQAGNYSVLVTNILGSTNSVPAMLTVMTYPPTIAAQPTNQTVQIGGTASFTATANGTAPLLYQWNFNGVDIVGATNATLTLTNVQSSQAGSYALSVTNEYGSTVSSNAVLSVTASLDHFAWSPVSSPQSVNQPFGVTITAQNLYNATVTNFTGAISLQPSGNGASSNSGLILNGGFETGTLTNWTLVKSTSGQFVINNGTVLPPGAVGSLAPYAGSYSVLGDESGPGVFYMYQDISIPAGVSGATLNWAHCVRNYYITFNSSQAFQVRICDTNNNVLATAFTTSPGNALLGNWVQTNYNMTAFAGQKVRVMFWVDSTYSYIDAYVDNVSLQLPANLSVTPTNTGNFVNGVWNGSVTVQQTATNVVLMASDGNGHAGSSNPFNVVAPAYIMAQPTNQTVLVGGAAAFSVTATGTAPLTYQWSVNGTNIIVGATNSTLTLTNVQLSQNGYSYSVLVANLYGSTNSGAATLTVNGPVCTPAPSGMVAWWPAEGNANDIIGGNNGTMVNSPTFAAGEVGQAFLLSGSNYVSVPDAPVLNPTNAITVECWLYRQAVVASYDAVVKKSGTAGVSAANGYSLEFNGNNILFWIYNSNGGWQSSGGAVPIQLGQWYHIAGVYDGAHLLIYTNGQLAASSSTSGSIVPSVNILCIGNDPIELVRFFNGSIDEVSIYNRALSSNEIAAIYNAGSAGKCFTPVAPAITTQPANQTVLAGGTANFSVTASGTGPLSYQWCVNGTKYC